MPAALGEVERAAGDLREPLRHEPLGVDLEHPARGEGERPVVDVAGSGREVRMPARAVRRRIRARVHRADARLEALLVERVGDRDGEPMRVAGLGGHLGLEHRAGGRGLGDGEVGPGDEAVQGVAAVGLRERELLLDALEGVAAVDDAVRPRHEHGAAEERADRVGREGHDEVAAVGGERAEARADGGDLGDVPTGLETDLGTGQRSAHPAILPNAPW